MNEVLLDPYHACNEDECLAPEEVQARRRKRKTLNPQANTPPDSFLEK